MRDKLSFSIYQDGNLVKTFNGQLDDARVFGYLINLQNNSVYRALSSGEYKVTMVNERTNKKTQWNPYKHR